MASAQQNTAPARISEGEKLRIQLPQELRGAGRKLRIRNLESGREVILDSQDEEFLASERVQALIDAAHPVLTPEVSVLAMVPERRRINFPNGVGYYYARSLVFDQPEWKPLGFRVRRDTQGLVLQIQAAAPAASLTPLDAARRRSLQESRALKRLFEIGWEALGKRRYDVGLEAFDRLLARKTQLSPVQRSQAHLGRGIALFHQKGCPSIAEDFREADRDASNRDDVSYYRGLCLVESGKTKEAAGLFQGLLDRQNPRYADQSRFYLGVVAENEERWDDADSFYLDTIDFASDKGLAELAKQRLESTRRARAAANYQFKVFSVGAILGAGYDSNVVGLPRELSPSAYNVTDEASVLMSGIGFLEVKPRWGERIDHRLRATAVAVHYANGSVADMSDLQTYDATTTFAYSFAPKETVALGAGYTSVFRGPLGRSGEYVAVPYGEIRWYHSVGEAANPEADMETSLKYLRTLAKQTPASSDSDPTANAYVASWRYAIRRESPHVFGPGVDFEFHPAVGSDVSYYSLSVLGRWDFPVWQKRGLYLGQEGTFQWTPYYQTASSRKDYILRYSGSLSKSWTSWLETRFQVIGTLSFSSDKANYQYQKIQTNLLLTLVY